MNEQIQKFVDQAKQSVPAGLAPEQWLEIYHTKFVELIVKECSMLVEGFTIEQEVALDDYQEYEASAVLKEHFGVKE